MPLGIFSTSHRAIRMIHRGEIVTTYDHILPPPVTEPDPSSDLPPAIESPSEQPVAEPVPAVDPGFGHSPPVEPAADSMKLPPWCEPIPEAPKTIKAKAKSILRSVLRDGD